MGAENYPIVRDAACQARHDGPGTERGWKDEMYLHSDESNV